MTSVNQEPSTSVCVQRRLSSIEVVWNLTFREDLLDLYSWLGYSQPNGEEES